MGDLHISYLKTAMLQWNAAVKEISMKRSSALLSSAILFLPLLAPTAQAQQSRRQVRVGLGRYAQCKTDSAKLSPLETQVLGQRSWLSGGRAALRVIVTDHQTGKPLRADV